MAIIDNKEWRDFFETYKTLTELWQTTNDNYKNKMLREKAWHVLLYKYHEIDPNATVDQLKQKVNNIRTSYRRELRKVLATEMVASSIENVYVPGLWYYQLLNFLREQNPTTYKQEGQPKKRKAQSQPKREPVAAPHVENTDAFVNALKFCDTSETGTNTRDDASVYADAWACSFRKLSIEQQLFAKKAIDEILYFGQMEKLQMNNVYIA